MMATFPHGTSVPRALNDLRDPVSGGTPHRSTLYRIERLEGRGRSRAEGRDGE